MKKGRPENLLPLVSAATMASEGFKEGRATPILVINAEGHETFLANIQAHETAKLPGDMIFTWAWPKSRLAKSMVYIKIEFIKPIKCHITISIDPVMHGEVIDAILLSKILTIIHGDGNIATLVASHAPSISMDVPEEASFPKWDKIYLAALTKRYRRQGIKRKRSIELAKQHILSYRKGWITKKLIL